MGAEKVVMREEETRRWAWLTLLALKTDKGPRATNVGKGGNRISLQPEKEPALTPSFSPGGGPLTSDPRS